MTTYRCPACQRSFDEAGFCPFDRSALLDPRQAAAQATILSMAMDAEAEPRPTIVDRHSTLPLTPAPAPAATPVTEQVFRAVSASDNATAVRDAYRDSGPTEYDRLVGQTLDGRYFVEKKIGEGGMGVVFAARHAVIERPLAIKVLKREVMRDTGTIQRFVQEAKAASRIGHPNIVDVTDFGTTPDGMTYSVMEFVVGETLGAAIRAAAPFPPLRAVKIAAQIARALGAAHDKGIVHRDLKPENVFLVDREGRTDFVKIVDFGIAKVAPIEGTEAGPRLTRAGSVFGTPEYMAPEQAAGRSDTDARVDVYALGVILYEMICGRVPHRSDSMVRTLAMQMLDAPAPPSKVRPDLQILPELEAVIMTALAKKREQRHASMGDFLAALERVLVIAEKTLTGSPIYALAPLPPGATPGGASGAAPGTTSGTQPPRRAKSATSKVRHEPEFVASRDKPPTFEHVWTETELPLQPRRWPLVLLGVLVAGGLAGAMVLVMNARGDERDNAGRGPRDAAVVSAPVDAGPADAGELTALADAAVEVPLPVDAGDGIRVITTGPGPRRPRPDAAVTTPAFRPDTPNRRGTMMVQVITKPEGATLYVGTSYRGPGGATLEEPFGAKLAVRCTLKGYKDGTVQLAFDGSTEVALCVLERIKLCVDNIKNPFDDCELAP